MLQISYFIENIFGKNTFASFNAFYALCPIQIFIIVTFNRITAIQIILVLLIEFKTFQIH